MALHCFQALTALQLRVTSGADYSLKQRYAKLCLAPSPHVPPSSLAFFKSPISRIRK